MDRVAEAAGVAKGTLYLYFPSKDALYLGVSERRARQRLSRLPEPVADPKLPVVERLRRSIGVMVEFYDQRRDFLQFYATEEPRLSDARNRIIEGSRERGFNFFASLIEEGIRIRVFSRASIRASRLSRSRARFARCCCITAPSRPVAELEPRARQHDASIARRGSVAALPAGASAMIRTLVRRVIRLAILAGIVAGFYFFGRSYLWPPEDRSTIKVVGMIEAPEVNITSRIGGRIKQLDLLEGDHVTKGQVVALDRGYRSQKSARASRRRTLLIRRPTWRRRGATSRAMKHSRRRTCLRPRLAMTR